MLGDGGEAAVAALIPENRDASAAVTAYRWRKLLVPLSPDGVAGSDVDGCDDRAGVCQRR